MKRLRIYNSLQRSISQTALVTLMIRQGDGLDGLSEDLWKIIKNPTTSWLYTQALFLDCCDLLRLETYYEFRKEQIQD